MTDYAPGPDLYIAKRDIFRDRVLLSLDEAAKLTTNNPLAMGATDQDLPELFRLVDRLFDDVMARGRAQS
jgi:hypothetical protein